MSLWIKLPMTLSLRLYSFFLTKEDCNSETSASKIIKLAISWWWFIWFLFGVLRTAILWSLWFIIKIILIKLFKKKYFLVIITLTIASSSLAFPLAICCLDKSLSLILLFYIQKWLYTICKITNIISLNHYLL